MSEVKCMWRYNSTERVGGDEKRVSYRCLICSAEHSVVVENSDDGDYRPPRQVVATCTLYRPAKEKRNAAIR